jgi:hypothetical protein
MNSNNGKNALVRKQTESSGLLACDTMLSIEQPSRDIGPARKNLPKIKLSIIIPAYNEQNRLTKTVLETIIWCEENCTDYEIIIVDDGSTDQTFAIGKLFAEYHDNVYLIANPHLGKGAAVRSGMLNASGDHVLFMDADGATPLGENTEAQNQARGRLCHSHQFADHCRSRRDFGGHLLAS